MVRQCYLCKVYSYQIQSLDLSFHRLPSDPQKRNIWISALRFTEGQQFPKLVEICSNHFQQSDFVYRADGTKYLKQHAVPLCTHSLDDPVESTSSDSTFGDSLPKHEKKSICFKTEEESEDERSSFENSPDKKRPKLQEDIFSIPGPSSNRSPHHPAVPVENIIQEKVAASVPVESYSSITFRGQNLENDTTRCQSTPPSEISDQEQFMEDTTASQDLKSKRSGAIKRKIIYAKKQMQEAFEHVKGNMSDEYDLFGKLIAIKLRKIRNPETRDIVMNDIHNIIFRARMTDRVNQQTVQVPTHHTI